MLLLPADILALLAPFAPLFSRRSCRHVPMVVVGAILAPRSPMVLSWVSSRSPADGLQSLLRAAHTGYGRDRRHHGLARGSLLRELYSRGF